MTTFEASDIHTVQQLLGNKDVCTAMFPTKPRRLTVLAFWSLILVSLFMDVAACGEPRRPDRSGRGAPAGFESLRTAVESLHASFPSQYPGEAFLRRLADLRRRLGDGEPSPELRDELKRARREMLVDENPLLKSRKLLFVKRNTYGSYHYYDDHDNGIIRAGMGGNLCVLSLKDGTVREVAPQLAGGLFDRYDLSFDGRRIVFGYCDAIDGALRLWEIRPDGTGLHQVTFPPPGETAEARAALSPSWWPPGGKTARDGQGNLSSRRFMTQDFHPCYLPDGRIAFTSTRAKQTVLCGDIGLSVPNLFRIGPDGSGLVRLSRGALNELCPTVLNDGRILYNRWEYIFKSLFLVQPLWTMYPDGGRSEEIVGNNIGQPGVFIQGRAVPGRNDLIVCTGASHEQMAVGPILLVDLKRDKRSPKALRSVTPEVESRGTTHRWFLRNGKMVKDTGGGGPVFCDPYPLSDRFFLVSHNPDKPISNKAAYGIWLIDVFGNRVPVYKDPAISCWQPMPLEPRPTPPVLSQTTGACPEDKSGSQAEGTLFLQDVHQGLIGAKPGSVKYLRVVEQVPRGWDVFQQAAPDDGGNGSPRAVLNKGTHIWVAVLHGVVPVQADGSALFTVPADRNIFLQALDQNYMEVQTMRTFVNLRPGERRSCIGCHEDRRQAPSSRAAAASALRQPPLQPQGQPGDAKPSRPVHYSADVQPVLDKHCVRCHRPQKREGKLDLSGELTLFFNRSYEELIDKRFVRGFNEWSRNLPDTYAQPAYSHGSHVSKLIRVLRGEHYEVKLSKAEFVRLVTWVDLNLPYYGSYYGKRNIKYRGQPDFRPTPTLESACGMGSGKSP